MYGEKLPKSHFRIWGNQVACWLPVCPSFLLELIMADVGQSNSNPTFISIFDNNTSQMYSNLLSKVLKLFLASSALSSMFGSKFGHILRTLLSNVVTSSRHPSDQKRKFHFFALYTDIFAQKRYLYKSLICTRLRWIPYRFVIICTATSLYIEMCEIVFCLLLSI